MQQVLLRIPLKVDWLPLPLWAVLLILFLGAAAALYWGARYVARRNIDPKAVQAVAIWVGVGGLIIAALVRRFEDDGMPIYGFGMMLFLAFVVCNWLGARLAVSEGVGKETIQDIAIWLIIGGLVGARLTSTVTAGTPFPPLDDFGKVLDYLIKFISIWDGGIVLFGAVIGGLVSYLVAYYFVFRKKGVSTLKVADILAPCLAIGLCLGRIGCFLNGCCYGQVACAGAPVVGVPFPLSAPPREYLVGNGYQTAAGFTFAPDNGAVVDHVDPDSDAAKSGLRDGDVILQANDTPVRTPDDLRHYLKDPPEPWPLNKTGLTLLVPTIGDPARTVVIRNWRPGVALSATLNPVPALVNHVEPDSQAARATLQPGDVVVKADDKPIASAADFSAYINSADWRRGKNDITLVVRRGDALWTLHFWPWTLRLHPTQLYESISMILLFLVLIFYYPFRRHPGQVMAVLMVGYGTHRYLNELLRADQRPVDFEWMTSVVLVVAGVALWLWLAWRPVRQPARAAAGKAPSLAAASAGIRANGTDAVSSASAPTTATTAARPGRRRSGR